MEQVFGARRCRDTRKPRAEQCPDVTFYRCSTCGALFPVTGAEKAEGLEIFCCGKTAEKLEPRRPEEVKVFKVFTSVFVVLLIAESEELTKVPFLAA